MNKSILAILFLVVTFFTSCKEDAPTPTVIQPPATTDLRYSYLALGDSYTIGQGVPVADQWGMQLAGLLRAEGIGMANPVTIARTGWTTSELAAAITAANPDPNFDLVSLLIGVNNQYRRLTIAAYREEFKGLLQTAIRLAKGKPAHVLVLSIPDWGATPFGQASNPERIAAEIDAFNAVAREEAQAAGVTFIYITPLTRQKVSDLSYVASDGLHYSGKMHREWALLALPKAKEVLK